MRKLHCICFRSSRARARRGFTLIELLVVMAIVAILIALLLPAVQQAREAARRTTCLNHLKQIGVAFHNYHETHSVFPSGYVYRPGPNGNESGFGWGTMLLPYLEQSSLFKQLDLDKPIWDAANEPARKRHLSVFLCPNDSVSRDGYVEMGVAPVELYGMASFVACFGPPDLDAVQDQRKGMFSRNSATTMANVLDGSSQTLMAGERVNGPFRGGIPHGVHFSYETTWAGAVRQFDEPTDDHGHMVLFQTGHTPNNPLSDDRDVSAPHFGYAQFLFADGHVRTVSSDINFAVYQALSTMADSEPIDGF